MWKRKKGDEDVVAGGKCCNMWLKNRFVCTPPWSVTSTSASTLHTGITSHVQCLDVNLDSKLLPISYGSFENGWACGRARSLRSLLYDFELEMFSWPGPKTSAPKLAHSRALPCTADLTLYWAAPTPRCVRPSQPAMACASLARACA